MLVMAPAAFDDASVRGRGGGVGVVAACFGFVHLTVRRWFPRSVKRESSSGSSYQVMGVETLVVRAGTRQECRGSLGWDAAD